MAPLRLGVLIGALSGLVGCSVLLFPDDLSGGGEQASSSVDPDGAVTARTDIPDVRDDDAGGGSPDAADADLADADAGADDAADSALPEEDSSPPNPCLGKADGFAYAPGDEVARCCGGQPVDVNTAQNCGSCGIACGNGSTCSNPVAGQWGCTCTTDEACAGKGYGGASTCFFVSGKGFCNCQCPGGALTCVGQCTGGSVCHDDVGQNYCAYP